jgi:hypothetical protein
MFPSSRTIADLNQIWRLASPKSRLATSSSSSRRVAGHALHPTRIEVVQEPSDIRTAGAEEKTGNTDPLTALRRRGSIAIIMENDIALVPGLLPIMVESVTELTVPKIPPMTTCLSHAVPQETFPKCRSSLSIR